MQGFYFIFRVIASLCLLIATASHFIAGANGQTVDRITNPLPKAWVIDQTETLSDLQKRLIGELCEEIQTSYNRQMVVAVIASTNGREHRRFAVELFNQWRIGAGYKNQGVLVFAAMEDRAAEIILGHGIDNRDTVRAAKSIMNNVMVPKFKSGDAGGAIYEGVHACSKRIIGVGKLKVAPKLPKITAEQPVVMAEKPFEPGQELPRSTSSSTANAQVGMRDPGGDAVADKASGDSMQAGPPSDLLDPTSTENSNGNSNNSAVQAKTDGFVPVSLPARPTASKPTTLPRAKPRRPARRQAPSSLPWVIGIGGVGLIGSFFGIRHYLRYRSRTCETCQSERVLLTEIQDDEFLNKPQRIEEKIGSVDYDVWACLECEDVIKLRYGRWLTRYSRCPDCSYVTRFKITKTLVVATTVNGGRVRVKEYCKHCDYQHTYTYSTPRIQKSRSRSSGGGGFSSGSGSSGGGFSSGGGASGRW